MTSGCLHLHFLPSERFSNLLCKGLHLIFRIHVSGPEQLVISHYHLINDSLSDLKYFIITKVLKNNLEMIRDSQGT